MRAPKRELPPSKSRYSDPRIISSSRECMHAPLYPHSTVEAALSRGISEAPSSPWVQQLTPARMRFHLAPSPMAAPTVRPAVGFDTAMAGWHDIDVPLSWQMDPEVADEPLYTNTRYALPGIDSAAALRTFLYLTIRTIRSARTRPPLRCPNLGTSARSCCKLTAPSPMSPYGSMGCQSAMARTRAFLTSLILRMPCEPASSAPTASRARRLVVGAHALLQIAKWCDGCYLEKQDAWTLSGLHRHLRLLSKPLSYGISDYSFVTTHVETSGDAHADENGASSSTSSTSVKATLKVRCTGDGVSYDKEGNVVYLLNEGKVQIVASLHGPCMLSPGKQPAKPLPVVWRSVKTLEICSPPNAEATSSAALAHSSYGEELEEAGGLLTGGVGADFEIDLSSSEKSSLKLWSAEEPHLYTLLIELRAAHPDGGHGHSSPRTALIDCESRWVD